MQLLLPEEYYQQLSADVARARQRIVLAAMVIVADAKIAPLLQAMAAAAKRGVAVHILTDVFYKAPMERERGQSFAEHRRIITATGELFAELQAEGVRISCVGKLGLNPFAGRSHVKISIVDDTVYSFGGVNASQGAFDNADYMLCITDKTLAVQLQKLVAQIANDKLLPDQELPLGPGASVLFDGGTRGKSTIYEHACQLAAEAKRIYYVSQMVPSGRLGELIKQTDYKVYFNQPEQGRLFLRLSLLADGLRAGISSSYHRERFIHAKFILFELKDGSRALLSGSHNFSWRGVAYGTKEIALCSADEALWQSLAKFLRQEIE
jgi:cardiolipin synthase A/B